MSPTSPNLYDELPYEDIAYYHTHPSNLAVVAKLCGLKPPPVETCRVLELGCGTGYNLLAMTQSLPQAHFVGIDFSTRQIAVGNALATRLKMDRIALHARDIAEVDASLGQFDYIIAHGVLSWIPPAVRAALWGWCKRHLAPQGIAYLSYNTYPGWHLRSILRDSLRFNTPANIPLLEQVRRARSTVEQLLSDLPEPDTHYGRFLRAEVESLRNDSDSYLAHEHLESDNQPFRFNEFVGMASTHGLRFFSEARFETNSLVQNADIQQKLDAVSSDLVVREGYHDLLRNRSFRQSLLCHAEVKPTWSPSLAALAELRIYSQVEPRGMVAGEGERFRLNDKSDLVTADAELQAILHNLHECRPGMITVKELTARLVKRLGHTWLKPGNRPEEHVAQCILTGYTEGWWYLFDYDPPYVRNVSQNPQACPLARLRAEQSAVVTNRLHRPVRLTEAARTLLRQLDGMMSREGWAGNEADEGNLRLLAESALLVQ